jgi:hypothetical protein
MVREKNGSDTKGSKDSESNIQIWDFQEISDQAS